jgi:uncharacterized SAM-binding protein YcdF (DUF218 family)
VNFAANMKLTIRGNDILPGVLLGALIGFVCTSLGLADILPRSPDAPAVVLVFALLGGIFARQFSRSVLSALAAVLFGCFVVVAFTPLMDAAAPRWVRLDRLPSSPAAIVVLSSELGSNGALGGHGLDRLLTGVSLARNDTALLVTTRFVEHSGGRTLLSDDAERELVDVANLASRWRIADTSFSTRDEAVRTAALLGPGTSIVVVTSPMHTRRACAVFEKAGFVVSCLPAREHGAVTAEPRTARDRLEAFRQFSYEILASVEYRLRGWI